MLSDKINANDCVTCPIKCKTFEFLSIKELRFLDENRYEAHFKAGETIFKQGSPTTHLISFTKGLAKIYIENMNGRDVIISLVQPTGLIGGPGIFTNRRHHYSVSALEDAIVCFIDIKAFKDIFRSNADFAESIVQDISLKDIRLMQKLVNISLKQTQARIAELLLYLSSTVFKSDVFNILLSRQEIADITGMSKEGSIRIIKDFVKEGLIHCEGQNFKILDKEKLKNIWEKG